MISKIVPNIRHYIRIVHITSVSLVVVVALVIGLPHESMTYIPNKSVYVVTTNSTIKEVVEEVVAPVAIREPVKVKQTPVSEVAKKEPVQTKIKVYTHKGGKKISPSNLKDTISSVASRLSSVPNDPKLYKLIYETAKVESTLGKNIHSSGGLGIMQITESTAKCNLSTIKKANRRLYNEVMALYDNKLSMRDNLLYNVPFSIGVSMVVYCNRAKNDILSASTIEDRARIWKKHYNTHKGKGTVRGYIVKNT